MNSINKHHFFHFEANSIQSFILDTGRLADMVGGSELIEDLINKPFDSVLKTLGIDDKNRKFVRRAGGAITLKLEHKSDAEKLSAAWSLIVPDIAPGLAFRQCVCTVTNEQELYSTLFDRVRQLQSQPFAVYPPANPLVRRAARTGNAAVAWGNVKSDRQEFFDQATKAKRQRKFKQGNFLEKRWLPDTSELTNVVFPRNLDSEDADTTNKDSVISFPFHPDQHYLAAVHIDGNALGQHIIQMQLKNKENSIELLREFSISLQQATEEAAQRALADVFTEEVMERHAFPFTEDSKSPDDNKSRILPFRPLVLGGDDLTV